MSISKLMTLLTVIVVTLNVIPAYAVNSSDADIQTLNVEISASDTPFTFKLDPIVGLKPGFTLGDVLLAKGVISGDEPRQYGVVFDSPGAKNTATFSGKNNSSNLLKVRLWVDSKFDSGSSQFGDWYVFPVAKEVMFEVRNYNAAMVNADVYTIVMYAAVYTD